MREHSTRRSFRKRFGNPARPLTLFPLPAFPEIRRGQNLAKSIVEAARRQRLEFEAGDIVVVAQKIISKAEGRVVSLRSVRPSVKARALAKTLKNDPWFIEMVLRESRRIVRAGPRVLIVETRHGFVCANAGVDRSNVPGRDSVTLLPLRPDDSARRLAAALRKRTGKRLHATILAVADELAAAAGLVMGKAEGVPVVVVRGYRFRPAQEGAARIIRPAKEDLFR